MSSSNEYDVTLTSADDMTLAATNTLSLKTGGYAVLAADKYTGAVAIDSVGRCRLTLSNPR